MIVIFTKKSCPPCLQTKKYLAKIGVEYTEKPVEEEKHLKEMQEMLGVSTVPVVVYGNEVIVGYNPSRLAGLLRS